MGSVSDKKAKTGSDPLVVIFEAQPKPGSEDRYFDLAAELLPALEKIDGFISIERFSSLGQEGKFLSLSVWRDEQAIRAWREFENHRAAQKEGREKIFHNYRIRVARIVRDYGMNLRAQAPGD